MTLAVGLGPTDELLEACVVEVGTLAGSSRRCGRRYWLA